jgi:peptidoglycan/xylan/chitin deacetylase (PgdA/CDA1 family)
MSWFAYTTLWTLSLAGTLWVLVEDPLIRLVSLAGLFFVYLCCLVVGSIFPQLNFYFVSFSRGPSDQGSVALTFDDGPDPKILPKLLELLKDENVKATFFMIGRAVEMNPEEVTRVEADGHLIGNHMYFHSPWWPFQMAFLIRDELVRTNQAFAKIIGRQPRLVRMPFSIGRPGLARVFRKLNMVSIGWDVRGLEGLYREPKLIAEHIAKNARNGSIVLLHERYFRTKDFGADKVIATVREVITGLRERGFVFQRVDAMLGIEGYRDEV